MTQYWEEKNYRDEDFVKSFTYAFANIQKMFEEWATLEIRAQQTFLEENGTVLGAIRADLKELQLLLTDLNLHDFEEAKKRVRERIEEIKTGTTYNTPLEHYYDMVDCFAAMERLMRRLLTVRLRVQGEEPE